MTAETLLSASRRLIRYFNGDMAHGGLIKDDTLWAAGQLERMVALETAAEAVRRAVEVSVDPPADKTAVDPLKIDSRGHP